MSNISRSFEWKKCGKIVKIAVFISSGTNIEKTFFEKNYRFIDFLRASGENVLAGCSKLHSIFPEEHFARKVLSENVLKFINVLRASLEKFFAVLSKLLSICSEELFRGKTFFEKVRGSKLSFGLRLKNFRKFFQNCFLIFQGRILVEIFYLKKLKKPYNFSVFFDRILKTAFYNFNGTFMEITFVWKKLQVRGFSSRFGKKIQQVWESCILFFQRNVLGRNNRFEKKLSVQKPFRRSGKNFSERFSKSNSTFPVELFRKKLFIEKICKFTKFLRASGEKFASSL